MTNLNSILSGSLIFRDKGTELSRIVPGENSVNITGSLRVSGSAILLNGSDLAYRIVTLEAGQGADQVQFGNITLWTASMNDWSSSVDDYIGNINDITASFNEFTASEGVTTGNLEFTSSQLVATASIHEERLDYLESKPIVSSSRQIFELGFLTSSIQGIVSSSEQIWDLGFITASRWSEILEIPEGIISSSAQIDELFNIDGLISSSTQLESEISGAFVAPSSSFSIRVTDLEYFSSSLNDTYATDAELDLVSSSLASDITTNATNTVNNSASLAASITTLDDAFTTASGSLAGRISVNETDIFNLQYFSSSLDNTYATDAQLSSLSSSISTDLTDLSSSVHFRIDNINELSGSSTIGSDLLNIHSITGSVGITGSLTLQNSDFDLTGSLHLNFDGVTKYFQIDVNGEEKIKVNEEGIMQFFSQSVTPTAVEGGIYYGSDYNLYLGVNT